MTHKCKIVYRRRDGMTQSDGLDYGFTYCLDGSGRPSLAETLRKLQDQGQYIVGVSFICESPDSGCLCQSS
jgi:hypothetical protein